MDLYAGIEAGGTKFVCAAGTGPSDLVCGQFPTSSPDAALAGIRDFFRWFPGLRAAGIASFGPLDLDPSSATFGFITSTPKPGWRGFDLAGSVRRALGVAVAIDTDVNAAALAESRWGAATGLSDALYITIGTGIGGGGIAGGSLIHGLVHPEMGHIRIPRDPGDAYPGGCPYHGDCLEGLASGPAIAARWGAPAHELPDDHPAWRLEARYLALAAANWTCVLSPKRIILGGGVMQRAAMFPLVRAEFLRVLNGYVQTPAILNDIDSYLVPPGLGARSGVLGGIALAAGL